MKTKVKAICVFSFLSVLCLSACDSSGTSNNAEGVISNSTPTNSPVPTATPTPSPQPTATATPLNSPSPVPTATPCADLNGRSWAVFTSVIYSKPNANYPTFMDTITASIVLSFRQWDGSGLPGSYTFCGPGSYSLGCPDFYWQGFSRVLNTAGNGSLTCNYDQSGTRTLNNSYCPQILQIQQTDCPQNIVTITGNFQAVYPQSSPAISSSQIFTRETSP